MKKVLTIIFALCLFVPFIKVEAYTTESEVVTSVNTSFDKGYALFQKMNQFVETYKDDLIDSYDYETVLSLNSYDIETLINKTVEALNAKNHTAAKNALLELKPTILSDYEYVKNEYKEIKTYLDNNKDNGILAIDDVLIAAKQKTGTVKTEVKKLIDEYYDILEAKVKEEVEKDDFDPTKYEALIDKVYDNFMGNDKILTEISAIQDYYNDYHLEDFNSYISGIVSDYYDSINQKYNEFISYLKTLTKAKVNSKIDTYKVDLNEEDIESIAVYNDKVLKLIDKVDYYERYYNNKTTSVNDLIKIEILKDKIVGKENEVKEYFSVLKEYIRTFLIDAEYIELVNEEDSSFITIDHKEYLIIYDSTELDSEVVLAKLKAVYGDLVVEKDFNGKIGTTSKVVNKINDNVSITYTVVVKGDVYPDGKISSQDYIRIKNHIMGDKKITDKLLKIAADANSDDKISSKDYVRIKNIIMKEDED